MHYCCRVCEFCLLTFCKFSTIFVRVKFSRFAQAFKIQNHLSQNEYLKVPHSNSSQNMAEGWWQTIRLLIGYTGAKFPFEDCLMECKLKIYKCLQTKFIFPTTIMHS